MTARLILCAAVLSLVMALPALAETSPPPAIDVPKPATESKAPTGPHADHRQPVCVVTGRVQAMQAVERTPWEDEAPTTLTITEVHIVLALESRVPQRKAAGTPDCTLPAGGGAMYKLCSPTQLAPGMRIKGTEGLATGADSAMGCLFDVAIMPAAAAPTAPAPATTPPPAKP